MVWTDAFQMVVMIVGFLTVLIQGSNHVGGFDNVLEQARNGSRLDIVEYVQCYFSCFIKFNYMTLYNDNSVTVIPFVLCHSFDVDPLRRHTFWTIAVGGTFTWLGIYGVNQSTIQRCISCKTEKHAKL